MEQYALSVPKMPDRNSGVSLRGEKILYRYSFCRVFGLMIGRRVLMLKKPGEPTPSSGSRGPSSGGRVVKIVVGTSASGARPKKMGLSVQDDVKSVTWRVT